MKTIIPALAAILVLAASSLSLSQTLPETLTIKGEEYTGVRFTGRTPTQVKFNHSTGMGTFLISDLPENIRKDFPVEQAAASDFTKEQNAKKNRAATAAATQQADAKLDADTWEPFTSCIKSGENHGALSASQTKVILNAIQTVCRPLLESRKATNEQVRSWCGMVWENSIAEGMPSDLVRLSWGDPAEVNDNSSGSAQWVYRRGSRTQFIHVKNGVVTWWSNS